MTIIFYAHMGSRGHGANESLLEIVTYLAKKHNCYVVIPVYDSFAEELERRNIKTFICNYKISSYGDNKLSISNPRKSLGTIKWWITKHLQHKKLLKKHIEEIQHLQADLIYTNTSVINFGAMVAERLNIKHIWHLREFHYLRGTDFTLRPDFGFWYLGKQLRKASKVIVNSNIIKDYYAKIMRSDKKIQIIYNGIIIKEKQREDNIIEKKHNFLVVGSLNNKKGHIIILKAVQILKTENYPISVAIVGEGGNRQYLEKYVLDQQLSDYVIFLGQQNDTSIFYQSAQFYIMSSFIEAFGRVTVEAMMHKLPVIANNSPYNAAKEIIRDGIDGLLYNGTPEDLAQKMKWIIANQTQAKEMGENGYLHAKENFSFEVMIKKIERLLSDQISDRF